MAANDLKASFPKLAVARGYRAVPTSNTALTTVDTCLNSAYISNTTGGDLTLTMTDGVGHTPLPAVEILANQAVFVEAEFGALFSGGFSWQASGAGLQCDLNITTKIGYTGS